ncbi:glutathione S-transferase family protein [Roseiterribacter gracilis]|uniref:Thiol:disulfide oxidoreductase n=1 Tax=Roseiterribacter gracilis TaxID=2812848 RepID=A0A8S8X7P3_9PROT|nr:thiol:disulfide oxidoreductase [Rhodospirillales bacterium TMPK1]
MIDLFTYGTPNGRKVSIMLEETGLPYETHIVDIENGAQKDPAFVAISPNGKIPAIRDRTTGRTMFESGAILLHLAERSGKLRPDDKTRAATLQWSFFQAAHLGPMLGQLWHFRTASEHAPYALQRYERESNRLLDVMDVRLGQSAFLAGLDYGIADIMSFPWVDSARDPLALNFDGRPHLARWHAEIAARPAVQRGMKVPV